MLKLTQRLSGLIVAGLSAFTLFAAVRGACTVVSLAALASPAPTMTLTRINDTRQTIWDEGVRPRGAVRAEPR